MPHINKLHSEYFKEDHQAIEAVRADERVRSYYIQAKLQAAEAAAGATEAMRGAFQQDQHALESHDNAKNRVAHELGQSLEQLRVELNAAPYCACCEQAVADASGS